MRLFGTYKTRLLLDCGTCRQVANWFGDHGSHVLCKVYPANSPHMYKADRQEWKQNHVHETAEETEQRGSLAARRREERQQRVQEELRSILWQNNPALAAEVERGDARRQARDA